jgi:lysophospholipase L1-like esterase
MKLIAWNTLTAVLLTLLAIAGMEAYLRWTVPPMREGQLFEYHADSKRLKLMKPGTHMKIYGVEVQINDRGFRDNRASIPPKQPGEYRIIVLGDSFTFGPGVDYERLYTSRLQSLLQRGHPEVTVINLGVEGYNIIEYAAVLEEVGLSLAPDAVLLSLFPVNDFELDDYATHYAIAHGHPPAPAPWYNSLYVYRAYLYRAEELAVKALRRIVPSATADGPDLGWEKNIAALREIVDTTEARGLPLTIALLPHTRGFKTQRTTVFARINAYCAKNALPCVDLLEPLQASGAHDGALAVNALDSHPNAEYNRFIAEALAPQVEAMIEQGVRQPARDAELQK